MRLAETRYGASFYILFGPAIHLGVISRRKAYMETIQYEKDRNAGFLSPFGYSTPTVTAAVDAICSMEVFLFYIFPILFSMSYLFLLYWAHLLSKPSTIFFCLLTIYLLHDSGIGSWHQNPKYALRGNIL